MASGKLIQCSPTAKPENSSVTSLGTGMQALSGTINTKTPKTPKLWIRPVMGVVVAASGGAVVTADRDGAVMTAVGDGAVVVAARRARAAVDGDSPARIARSTASSGRLRV